jgi:hypothetical protein
MVHYVSHGTPIRSDGSQAYPSVCRSAVITELAEPGSPMEANHVVGLCVFNPTGLFFHSLGAGGVPFDAGRGVQGDPDCPDAESHGNPFRYCRCGWMEAAPKGGTWHWPERV